MYTNKESMMRSDSYVKENEKVWDVRSENSDRWSIPVSSEEIEQAKRGNWAIWLTPKKLVPASWFPKDISGKKILCVWPAEGVSRAPFSPLPARM